MAKIVTYYMSREEFRELAAAAVECRCKLVPAALADEPIEPADGIDGFPERCNHCLFWMPLLGKLFWREVAGCLTASNMTNLDKVVHASFSCRQEASRTFTRAQMVLEVSPDHPAARLLTPLFRHLEQKLDQLAPLDEATGLRLSTDCHAWMADGWTPEDARHATERPLKQGRTRHASGLFAYHRAASCTPAVTDQSSSRYRAGQSISRHSAALPAWAAA